MTALPAMMPAPLETVASPAKPKRVRKKKIKPLEDLFCRVCHRALTWKGNGRKPNLCPARTEHACDCGKVVFSASAQCACGAERPEVGWTERDIEDRSRCARLEARFAEVHTIVDALVADLGNDAEEARRSLMWVRSRLWSEANGLTNVGRLVPTGQAPSARTRTGWRGMQPSLVVFQAHLVADGVSKVRARTYMAIVRALRKDRPGDVATWVAQRCATLPPGEAKNTRNAVNRYLRSIGAPALPVRRALPVLA